MKSIHRKILTAFVAFTGVALLATPSRATQTWTGGDVFVGFRSTTAPLNGLIFDVGNISQFTNSVNIANFSFGSAATTGADLVNQFGANWYSDPTVTWGVFSSLTGSYALASKTELVNGTLSTPYAALNSAKTGTLINAIATVENNFQTSTAANYTANAAYQSGAANGTYYAAVNANPDFTSGAWASGSSIEGAVGSWLDLYQFTPGSVQLLNTLGQGLSVNNQGVISTISAVPEPSTYALLGFGTLLLIVAYRRKSVA